MKRTAAFILALVLVLALTGCDGKDLEEKINGVVDKIEAGADALGEKAEDLADKLNGVDEEPKPTDAPEPTEVPEPAEEPAEAAASDTDIRPEIKAAIDSYEEFFNEYADFMESYDASDISALSDYLSFLGKYTEYMQKLDELENEDLTDAETVYFTQATLRIDQRLLEVAN